MRAPSLRPPAEWVDQLRAAAKDTLEVPGAFEDQEGPRGHQLRAPLLSDGGEASPKLLSQVGTGMVSYEQNCDEDPSWPRTRPASPGVSRLMG